MTSLMNINRNVLIKLFVTAVFFLFIYFFTRFGVEHIDQSMLSTPSKLMSTVQGSLGMLTFFHWKWYTSVLCLHTITIMSECVGNHYFAFSLCTEFLGHYKTSPSSLKPSSAQKTPTWCLRRFAECGDRSKNRRRGLYWGPVVCISSHLSADS